MSVREIHSRLVDWILITAALAAVVLLPLILLYLRFALAEGIAWFYVVTAVGIWAMALMRRRLATDIKAVVILALIFTLGFISLIQFALVGGGILILSLATVLTVVVFGLRIGLIALAVSALYVLTIAYLIFVNVLTYEVDIAALAVSPVSWLLAVASMVGVTAATVVVIGLLQNSLYGTLRALYARNADLEVYEDIVRNMQTGLHVYLLENLDDDRSLKFTVGNPAAIGGLRLRRGEVLGRYIDEIFPGLRAQGIPQAYAEVVRTGQPFSCDDFPYGDERVPSSYFSFKAFPMPGDCVGVLFENTTARKLAEIALKESEQKFQTVFNQASVGIALVSTEGNWLQVNPAILNITGYGEDELVGHPFTATAHPGDMLTDGLSIDKLLSGEDSQTYLQKRCIRKDGGLAWVNIHIALVRDAERRPTYFIVVLDDITQTKQAEDALAEAHAQVQRHLRFVNALLSAMPVPVFWKDRDGRYLGANSKFLEQVGVTSEELVGKTVEEIWPSELASVYHERDDELMRKGGSQIYESSVVDKSGEIRNAVFSKGVFYDEQGNVEGLIGAYTDITDIRRTEDEKREFYRETISSVTDGKLQIVGPEEIEQYLLQADKRICVSNNEEASSARHEIEEYCRDKGLSGDSLTLFMTGLGEALTNSVKHAGSGEVFAGLLAGAVWAGVNDRGPGISTLAIPRATLRLGYSTKTSMGMGYSIMLEVSDRMILCTSSEGTAVVMFKTLVDRQFQPSLDDLTDTWDTIPTSGKD